MKARSAVDRPATLARSSSVIVRPRVVLEERPTSPSGVTSTEGLPRDVMVRLAALSRKVGGIRQEQAADTELSMRLDGVVAGLDGLIQRIYDETARHECD